ncbi:MAG: NAD+ synthase, partial [Candidatus Omnitrophota bacterium]
MLKIVLAQINSWVADLEGNAGKIIHNIRKAKKQGVNLLIFPELALVGYPPEDLLHKPHFIEKNIQYLKVITKEAKGIIVLVGFVDCCDNKIYNACAVLQDGRLTDVYHKIQLPNYGVFDEKRYFSPGENLSFYELEGYKFSISICEDLWDKNAMELLKNKGLDFIVNISASPFHLGKVALREKILSGAAKQTNACIFYCNLVGGQDELVFDGTSKIFSPAGKLIKYAKRFQEDFLKFSFNKNKKYLSQKVSVKEEEEAYSALRLGLFDYVKKNGFKKVIVGVSGGIDSAVVIALAAQVLGPDNVCALIMPSQYTSKDTFSDAKKICENLKIKYFIVNIEEILKSYLDILQFSFKGRKEDKTEENLQARIRGNVLMAFSNKFGYLVLNTGNKSEVSCGYCTLYGDMVGGFGVLKDVPKMLVYRIANYINKISARKIIPVSIIKRPPSAELKPNQKDTDSLPPYEEL